MVVLECLVDVPSLGQVPASMLLFDEREGGEIDARREPIDRILLLSDPLALRRAVSSIG
jgi:hypothetical protein